MLHCNGIDPFVTLMGNFNWDPFHATTSFLIAGKMLFRSYSRLDLGSFRSYSLLVMLVWPASFRTDFVGRFGPVCGSFWPTLFYTGFRQQNISC